MSPIEFSIACEAHRLEREMEQKRDKAHAWHVANFAMSAFNGKLDPLHKVLGIASGQRQSPQEMRFVLRGLKGGKAA